MKKGELIQDMIKIQFMVYGDREKEKRDMVNMIYTYYN